MTTTVVELLNAMGPEVTLEPHGHPSRLVQWGHLWQVGTPAYWIALTVTACQDGSSAASVTRHRLGEDLVEEVAACLLGGYGVPHPVGLAAFEAVQDAGVLGKPVSADVIEEILREPLQVGGRAVRYRFAAQRARYLALALDRLHTHRPPTSARALRDWLMASPGIGPKTAGWVVRNYLGSDQVAVIDIHIYRAGVEAGVFDSTWTPTRDYALLEELFLAWARHGNVSAADLDAVIWAERARSPNAYVRSRT